MIPDMGSVHQLARGEATGPSSTDEETGRVVPLRPRLGLRRPEPRPAAGEPIEDIGKYEGGGREDDYRHRMLMNVLGFLTCVVLVAAGVWIANAIAELRSHQDCVFSGRHDCAHIDAPSRLRP